MTEEMTGQPEGTVDAPTEEEVMEVGSTATEAREAANTAAWTWTTPEPEITAPTTWTPEAGCTAGDRSEVGKRADGIIAVMAGPQLRRPGCPRKPRQRGTRRPDEWSPGARVETAFPLQLARKYTAATRLLGSTSDLLALREKRTLLRRVPESADRREARAISGTKYHDGPHVPDRPAHRHAPKSGGGMALWRPALPLQPGARPNGAPPAPLHPPQSVVSTTPTHDLTLQLT